MQAEQQGAAAPSDALPLAGTLANLPAHVQECIVAYGDARAALAIRSARQAATTQPTPPAVVEPSKCKCTFAQKMVGDGCRYCNPQEYIDRLHEVLEDDEVEPLTDDHREINPTTGQQKGYVVLSEEERAKGYVRPVRRSYVHLKCGAVTTMAQNVPKPTPATRSSIPARSASVAERTCRLTSFAGTARTRQLDREC